MSDVDVYIHNQLSGRLTKAETKHTFSYGMDAREALSLTMPLRTESYNHSSLHPLFQMNLPEGYLREAIERATLKQYGSDDLSMLALLGNNQIGRLAYSMTGIPLPEQGGETPNLNALLSNNDADLFQQLLARYSMHSGVAGVQPKVLMDLNSKATFPAGSFIVKSWGSEFPELGCNEYVCMQLAQNAGLDVPEFYLSDNGKLLVSKRFDLTDAGDPLGFEDFCVLQAKTTREKYDASLESCTHSIRQYVSPEYQQQALYDFFKLTLVNVKVRNGDAHLKNVGVTYHHLEDYKVGTLPSTERKLAPIYDIVSTVPYIPNDSMALSITGSKRWPKWKVLQSFGRQHCGLNGKKMDQAIMEVEQAVQKSLSTMNSLAKRHPDFGSIAKIMSDLFRRPF